jgi:hypothetical protein
MRVLRMSATISATRGCVNWRRGGGPAELGTADLETADLETSVNRSAFLATKSGNTTSIRAGYFMEATTRRT